ncbi:MAG: D-arabinose 5-phosphate isomerase, partial [Succinivibrio sp.]|nr:D-arabinose 5-phosphate isomerase [Succinivibrio sp.]
MFNTTCINAGIRVLKEEAQALLDLVPTINENFAKACQIMLDTKGKVILTGVGKSGHVATKIASTLAS